MVECTSKKIFDKAGNPFPSFKEVVLCVAEQRNDGLSRVKRYIEPAIDLPAVEARYHFNCYWKFYKIPETSNLPDGDRTSDIPLQTVINVMNSNVSRLWNSLELHSVYIEVGGVFSRRTMINNLLDCLERNVVLVEVEGCASIIGFKEAVAKSLKLVKLNEEDESSVDNVVRKIRQESRSIKYKSASYHLSDYTHQKIVDDTSPTLLNLVSKLVSKEKTDIKSLSISQIIQSHITQRRKPNSTLFGC